MNQIIFGMLATRGQITMLGLSRWTEKEGSYRTIQRFYYTVLAWASLHWLFFKECFLYAEDEHIASGDENVAIRGTASDLFLCLWGRVDPPGIIGDIEVFRHLRSLTKH